jgi:hypothetical protein
MELCRKGISRGREGASGVEAEAVSLCRATVSAVRKISIGRGIYPVLATNKGPCWLHRVPLHLPDAVRIFGSWLSTYDEGKIFEPGRRSRKANLVPNIIGSNHTLIPYNRD